MAGDRGVFVDIRWIANPMRGDKFEEAWAPVAEAALDYGATYWAFLRSQEGQLDFFQHAIFPTKLDFERYWYSEEVAEARVRVQGLYQVPVLPVFHEIVGAGTAESAAPAG